MKSFQTVLNWSLVVMGIALIGLFISNPQSEQKLEMSSMSRLNQDSDLLNAKVNKYMQEVQRSRSLEEIKSLNRIQKSEITNSQNPNEKEIDPETISADRQIWKDQDKNLKRQETQIDEIYRRIYDDEIKKRQSEENRKAYAAQFIENARQSGYHIQLSMDLEVISVELIRSPQNQYDSNDIIRPQEQ